VRGKASAVPSKNLEALPEGGPIPIGYDRSENTPVRTRSCRSFRLNFSSWLDTSAWFLHLQAASLKDIYTGPISLITFCDMMSDCE